MAVAREFSKLRKPATTAAKARPARGDGKAAAVFLDVNNPQPVVLYEVVKGWLTGSEPELGEMHRIEK